MTHHFTPNNVEEFEIYKCAVRNCKNRGTVEVKIRFLKKSGRFCNFCIDELIKRDLIEGDEIKK